MTTASETLSNAQTELDKLVTDLRGLLASKDLDGLPEIKLLRQRLDEKNVYYMNPALNLQ